MENGCSQCFYQQLTLSVCFWPTMVGPEASTTMSQELHQGVQGHNPLAQNKDNSTYIFPCTVEQGEEIAEIARLEKRNSIIVKSKNARVNLILRFYYITELLWPVPRPCNQALVPHCSTTLMKSTGNMVERSRCIMK